MRAELANLNHCAVLFLSRAAPDLCWNYSTCYMLHPNKRAGGCDHKILRVPLTDWSPQRYDIVFLWSMKTLTGYMSGLGLGGSEHLATLHL